MQDGKIVEGLEPEDFEILEDGKPQQIESFDFVKFDTFTPEAERRDPRSQRQGFDIAADPRYRVFVIVVDMAFSTEPGAVHRSTISSHPAAAGRLSRSRARAAAISSAS